MNKPQFSQILQEYNPLIRGYLRQKCNHPQDIEDLFQECACAIYEALPRYAGQSSLSTWIYGICRNVYSNYVYYKKRDRNLKDQFPEPETHARPAEKIDLQILISRLPEALQTLYRLYYEQGLTIREVSEKLEKAEGTIKYLLHKLRSELRDLLA